MVDDALPRRRFLLGAGLAGATVASGLAGTGAPAEAQTAAPTAPAANPEPETYLTLTATEVAFLSAMTLGVQVIKVHMLQLGAEIEEAARLAGASWLAAFRRVLLPLTAPAIAVVAVLVTVVGVALEAALYFKLHPIL